MYCGIKKRYYICIEIITQIKTHIESFDWEDKYKERKDNNQEK